MRYALIDPQVGQYLLSSLDNSRRRSVSNRPAGGYALPPA